MTAFSRPWIRGRARRLLIVFGDQLDKSAPALTGLDREQDAVLMVEVEDEARRGPSHKQRVVMFLAAMRHFASTLQDDGYRVEYVTLDHADNTQSFQSEIERVGRKVEAEQLVATQPGEWRVLDAVAAAADTLGVPHEVLPDEHFFTALEDFDRWAEGRSRLTMEYFYREQRKRLGILVDDDGKPEGGDWNYDSENRESFDSAPDVRAPYTPRPDDITLEVCELVERRLSDLPGKLEPDEFRWPVTPTTARRALDDFIEHRLGRFGTYEDAMWSGEPVLYHSMLSAALNLKLLDPRDCVEAAVKAYENGDAPLNSVEGFVRQLIGWREFIRGVYWREGRDYRDRNGLRQYGELPEFFWNAETEMACLADCLRPVVDSAYSHHIPRLMVIGNFAMTAGIQPRAIGDWFYGMYTDAVDWVTTPNTIGMAMHADHAVVGTKPYAASGKYVKRMGNYCSSCRYDVNERSGPDACPFNVFYWDFLRRNRDRFEDNNRMAMMLKNLDRMADDEAEAITRDARRLRREFGIGAISR